MEEGLVSIIVPCYNKASTLERFLESVISQTYSTIQLIAVDDGSTDNTAEILKKWKEKFIEKGMQLEYIFQKNAGLGAAINKGLKYVRGEYLCWADPDDFYFPESVKKRVNILIKYHKYAVVSSDAYVFNENDLKHPIKKEGTRFEKRFNEDQFELCLIGKSILCPGCHMIRMSVFDHVNPQRDIYPARRGQNWQMLLPVYYKHKRYYLDEPLYGYVVSKNSMSSGDSSESSVLKRWKEHENIVLTTLKKMNMSSVELRKYEKIAKTNFSKERLYIAIDYKDYSLLRKEYIFLKNNSCLSSEVEDAYRRNKNIITKFIYKISDCVQSHNKKVSR